MSNLKLSDYVYKVNRPCLLRNVLEPDLEGKNSAAYWTFDNLASVFKNERFNFRIGSKGTDSNTICNSFKNY
jgi:hypothetical protein